MSSGLAYSWSRARCRAKSPVWAQNFCRALGHARPNVGSQQEPRDLRTDVFRCTTFSGQPLMMQAWCNYCWRPCEMRRKPREC
jgi:hypothetical protein